MPPKRKAKVLEDGESREQPRRSSRRTLEVKEEVAEKPKPVTKTKAPKKIKASSKLASAEESEADQPIEESAKSEPTKEASNPETNNAPSGRQYWLMKAEPETRLERGHDVRFSIDDLAAKTEPEPWDGIRAYPGTVFLLELLGKMLTSDTVARNNLRAMKKGDLAFFYHSNCKVPAIVGTMEIVQEHSPDFSAQDPQAAYYDPKDNKPEDPKWSVVHVTFKQKIKTPITLRELKAWQTTKGHPLENMQMLKLARLSVSKITQEEWDFLVREMEKNGDIIEQ